MPTNTQIIESIVAGTVPLDRNCPKSGQDVVNLVQDFCSINRGDTTGDSSNPNDSVAEQALNTANTALAGVQSLQAAQKETRSSGLIPVPTGDSNFAYTFGNAMPSTDYDISVAYYAGATGYIATYYGWRILESSITVNGFTIILDNTPANTKIAVRVVQR